jgi:oxygen-independent coproporphyrinogen-3 oxidase
MKVALNKRETEQPRWADARLPRAAYIHVPFCRHRCGYCNFTLVAGRDDLIADYLRAIELELSGRVGTAHHPIDSYHVVGGAHPTPRDVDTLYFGGGTPSHLSPEQLRTLATTVLHWHPLAAGYEWTLEANPVDIDAPMIGMLSKLGVTRLSLGGQSFRAEKLRLLERDHEAGDIERSVRWAQDAGMQVSLDLIFATPGETLAQWKGELDAAISLGPDHVSTYGLTFEQGTAFWNRKLRGELVEVNEDLQRDMYGLVIDRLTAAGYEHYEVSNFARPGCRSRHNQVYWSGDGYYAAGPGAARYVNGVRETNHRSTATYLNRVLAGESPVAEREMLPDEARARELLVFALRRIEGVSRREFRARTRFDIDDLVPAPLGKFVGMGLITDDGERILLTREGLFVSDALWPDLL